jgi:hypothetical protein
MPLRQRGGQPIPLRRPHLWRLRRRPSGLRQRLHHSSRRRRRHNRPSRRRVLTMFCQVLTIDACGQALKA